MKISGKEVCSSYADLNKYLSHVLIGVMCLITGHIVYYLL